MITINFISNVNNDSLQTGDLAYYVTPSPLGGFNQSILSPTFIGPVTEVINNTVQVPGSCSIDPAGNTTEILCDADNGIWTDPVIGGQITVDESNGTSPGVNDFIMFAKDTRVNLSGLVGYYAEVKISNNSTEKAEMFSIASEISVSSK